jgi:hypothetical protein
MTCNPPTTKETLHDWWIIARQGTPKLLRKALDSMTLLILWMVWKHRNACVFDHARPSAGNLISQIKDKVAAWVRAGAKAWVRSTTLYFLKANITITSDEMQRNEKPQMTGK